MKYTAEELYPGDENATIREHFNSGMAKLREAASRFVGERDRHFLKNFRGNHIDPEDFRDQLRRSINCRVSSDEMRALLPLLDRENSGLCDGAVFLILFYRIRHELRCQLLSERIETEKRLKEKISERLNRRKKAFEAKVEIEVPTTFSEEDRQSAMNKLMYAAARYDRLMPGTVQLDAFEGQNMSASLFREQLKSVFNMKVSLGELAALMDYFDSDKDGLINCAEFLIHFFRAGFSERTRQLEEERRLKKEYEDGLKKRTEDMENEKAKKNALKVDYVYDKQTKERAISKLREAAKLYDKSTPGAMNMNAFEGAFMEPHVFKEQLRRVFNLKLTPKELGALMDLFDFDGDGTVNCTEFTLVFATMGQEERDAELKRQRERQRQDEERRKKAEEDFQAEQARRHGLLVDYEFGEEEYNSAMEKLTEAAWRYDSTMPGAVSVAAFKCKSLQPHEFKEQLKRVFNISLAPKELGALIGHFDKAGNREIDCAEFLIEFVHIGFEERSRRRKGWLEYQVMQEKKRKAFAARKEMEAERKNNLKLEKEFQQEDLDSAMSKLTTAAIYYNRNSPGAVGLDAFEAVSMLPHVFKEQLKRAFNIRLNPKELGALMYHFDPENTGCVNCGNFLIEFFRVGFVERNRMRADFRKLKKEKLERDRRFEEEKLAENQRRATAEVDFEFTEEDFDSALSKLINMCHRFDVRQLGPAGFRSFETDKLTPSEYREVLKRTFEMKLTPQELGALVTYYDVNFSGTVSCSAFLNSFTQIRVNIEPHKVGQLFVFVSCVCVTPSLLQGKPEEAQFLVEYQAKLKEAYKTRIQRQLLQDDTLARKPWRKFVSCDKSILCLI
jgi:Ca2+-binding EF-hand superfamily protein